MNLFCRLLVVIVILPYFNGICSDFVIFSSIKIGTFTTIEPKLKRRLQLQSFLLSLDVSKCDKACVVSDNCGQKIFKKTWALSSRPLL